MTIETPRTSADVPSTRILTQFRASLDKRWAEFDSATLDEAFWVQTIRDSHPDYKATKQAFDEAKQTLLTIKDDAELKRTLNWPTTLSTNIQKIEEYLAKLKAPEKQKAYNQVLTNTLADISKLKSSLNSGVQKPEVVPAPVLAKKPETPTETAASTPVDDLLKPLEHVAWDVKNIALGAGTAVAATGLVSEWGMKKAMAEGFTKFKDWVMGIFEGDSIFAKFFGADIKSKLAGIFDKIGAGLPISSAEAGTLPEGPKTQFPNSRYQKTAIVFANLIKDSKNPPISEYLVNPRFQKLPLSTLQSAYKSKDYEELYSLVPTITDSAQKKAALDRILSHIFDSKTITARVLDSSFRAQEGIQKNIDLAYTDITLEKYFSAAWPSMSKIAAVPKAIASGGKSMASGLSVEDGQLRWVDESMGDLDNYKFSNPETRKKYLIAILTSTEWQLTYKPGIDKWIFINQMFASENSAFAQFSDSEKQEIRAELHRLLDFGDRFTKLLSDNTTVNLWMWSEMKGIMQEKGFTPKWLLIVSQMLSGNTQYEKMSVIDKWMLHSIVTSIFWVGEGMDSGKLAGAYVEKFSQSQAVADVRGLLVDIAQQTGKAAISWTWEWVKWAAWFMQKSPILWAWLIGINLPIFSESTSILWKVS